VRLSTNEKKLLGVLSRIGHAPVTMLARKSGMREHSVRYALEKLIARGALSFFPCVNCGILGYTAYSMYFSLSAGHVADRQRVLKHLIDSESVSWLAELGGDYQYGITFLAETASEFLLFLENLSAMTKVQFTEKAISVEFNLRYFPLKHFGSPSDQLAVDVFDSSVKTISIDEQDRKILSMLTSSGDVARAVVARALGIPASTLDARIARMAEKKVIADFVYFLNPEKLGLRSYKLLVYGRGLSKALTKALAEFAHREPNISLFVHAAGSWDYELNVDLLPNQDVHDLVQRVYSIFGAHITNVRTMPLFRHLKSRDFPFET